MFLRVATLIAAASATAAIGSAAPDAHADPNDQQFLDMVHSYGIGGQDETLKSYGHEFCADPTGVLPLRPVLYGQGVRPEQFYTIKEAASRAYCPDKIAMQPKS